MLMWLFRCDEPLLGTLFSIERLLLAQSKTPKKPKGQVCPLLEFRVTPLAVL